ncbi:DUF1963 domain-containing protein [Croceicoccus sediminis]|uniref:DUF1963 domain-containing protein n=1 Tax=Croceicoccus sediminis TaxID=2571150 RepID=UPI0014794BAD|nr:DUF1963 domain-containing protein [Croceicoccus sediminis]
MKQAGSVRIIMIAAIVAGSIVAFKTALPQIPLSTTILASCIGLALIFLLYRSDLRRRREDAGTEMQLAGAPARDLNPASIRARLENRPLPQVSPPPMARDMQGAAKVPAPAYTPPPSQPVPLPRSPETPVLELVSDFVAEEPPLAEPVVEPPVLDLSAFDTVEPAQVEEDVLDLKDCGAAEAEEEILDLAAFETPQEDRDLAEEDADVLDLADFGEALPQDPTCEADDFATGEETEPVSFEPEAPEPTEDPAPHDLDWSNFEDYADTAPEKPLSLVPEREEHAETDRAPVSATVPASSPIEAARGHAIVLREAFPPSQTASLSFYGGLPVAPADFAWPRAMTEAGDIPLTFVMQWDCAKLAISDPTDLLPRDGAMYLFMDLDWSRPMAYRFVHAAGNGDDWAEVVPPQDLAPAYGSQAIWAWPICAGEDHDARGIIPRRLPHWPFEPVGMTLPGNDTKFWQDDEATRNALSLLDLAPAPAALPRGFERPFPAFPHDWSAVRTVCAWLLGQMRQPGQPAELTRWLDETRMLYAVASREEPFDPIPRLSANEMWGWMEQVRTPLELVFHDLVSAAINATIGANGKAMDAIPAERIAAEARAHRLSGNPHAPVPNRMFGTPSYVQGEVGQFVQDEVLLLEIGGNDVLGHFFGTGVLQFTIAPDDLATRNFDRVRMTVAAA